MRSGPNVWNNWKAGLLRELYAQAKAALTGDAPEDRRAQRIGKAMAALEDALAAWPKADLEAHLERGTDVYWLSADTKTQVRHAEMIRSAEAKGQDLRIETFINEDRSANEITVYTADHPGLFANIAGALALSGVTILDAKIATLSNGMALDSFWVQDSTGQAIDEPGQLKRMIGRIEDALRGKRNPAKDLAKAGDDSLAVKRQAFQISAPSLDRQQRVQHLHGDRDQRP